MRNTSLIVIAFITLLSCSKDSKFPTEKRFWTPEDYDNAIREIEFDTEGKEYPRFSNPETSLVIKKLVDHQNYEIILDDNELGLNHRTEISESFFEQYQKLAKLYSITDKQDKLIYSDELAEIEKFGLGLQLRYFKLGNDRIIEGSDNSEASRSVIENNEGTIVHNFSLYLDQMNHEKSYSESSLLIYAEGLTDYFRKLFEIFPKANFDPILQKSILLTKKIKSAVVKKALEDLIDKLESKQGAKAEKSE